MWHLLVLPDPGLPGGPPVSPVATATQRRLVAMRYKVLARDSLRVLLAQLEAINSDSSRHDQVKVKAAIQAVDAIGDIS